MKMDVVHEMLIQALEHEMGGVKVYETALKCVLNGEVIGEVSKKLTGAEGKALRDAYAEVEDQEDEHLYHSRGWMRELELQMLGLKAVLRPPEERKHVKTAVSAARAEHQRGKMR